MVRRVVTLLCSRLWVREELLFDNTAFGFRVNVGCGPAEERLLLTGLHAVADIYCENCHTTLGWKYEQAFELSQKYKEGKFIIELSHMIKDNGWD